MNTNIPQLGDSLSAPAPMHETSGSGPTGALSNESYSGVVELFILLPSRSPIALKHTHALCKMDIRQWRPISKCNWRSVLPKAVHSFNALPGGYHRSSSRVFRRVVCMFVCIISMFAFSESSWGSFRISVIHYLLCPSLREKLLVVRLFENSFLFDIYLDVNWSLRQAL